MHNIEHYEAWECGGIMDGSHKYNAEKSQTQNIIYYMISFTLNSHTRLSILAYLKSGL